MYDLANLTTAAVAECSTNLRRLGREATSMETVAGDIVRHLYTGLTSAAGPACAMVRFYKTHPLGRLPLDLQDFARAAAGDHGLHQLTKCLTLVATTGDEEAWNDRRRSTGHKAIPLPSPQTVEKAPMVAQLMKQLGLDIAALLSTDPDLLIDPPQETCNVFHVERAAGSAHIPAQDFVREYGIESVVGFGGLLPEGDLFTVIMFSRVPISADAAEMLKPLSRSVRVAVAPYGADQVFV